MSSPIPPTLGILCGEISRHYGRLFEAELAARGIPLGSGAVRALYYVDRCGRPRLSDLAAAMQVETMTALRFVDQLERAGLVERLPDPADRRSKRVAPTAVAAPVLDIVHAIGRSIREEATRNLSEAEQQALLEMLERVRDRLAETRMPRLAEAS